jgi:hypothetical protein
MSIVASITTAHTQTRLFEGSSADAPPATAESLAIAKVLKSEAIALVQLGHKKARYLQNSAGEHLLIWPMAGLNAHPKDTYTLAIQCSPLGYVRCQFRGPSRQKNVVTLFTRNMDDDALQRWVATFAEWALSTRTTR